MHRCMQATAPSPTHPAALEPHLLVHESWLVDQCSADAQRVHGLGSGMVRAPCVKLFSGNCYSQQMPWDVDGWSVYRYLAWPGRDPLGATDSYFWAPCSVTLFTNTSHLSEQCTMVASDLVHANPTSIQTESPRKASIHCTQGTSRDKHLAVSLCSCTTNIPWL